MGGDPVSRADIIPVNGIDIDNIKGLVDTAFEHLLFGWNEGDGIDAARVMDALTNLACAQMELKSAAERFEADEKADDSGVHAAVANTSDDDIKPAAGDVVEEPDDPVALARAMQGKRHGGPK